MLGLEDLPGTIGYSGAFFGARGTMISAKIVDCAAASVGRWALYPIVVCGGSLFSLRTPAGPSK
jgi:hypothetical protein